MCCDPFSAEQQDALGRELTHDLDITPAEAGRIAAWVLKHYDLAPPGSLTQIKADIAKLAREGYTAV